MAILYTSVATTTVQNTTTETSLLGTPLVMPADSLAPKSTLRFTMWGDYETIAVPGTLRIRFTVTNGGGTTTILDSGARTLPALGTGHNFELAIHYTQRTAAGGSADARAAGHVDLWTSETAAEPWELPIFTSGSTTTTVENTYDITAQFSTADVTNNINNIITVIEIVTGAYRSRWRWR